MNLVQTSVCASEQWVITIIANLDANVLSNFHLQTFIPFVQCNSALWTMYSWRWSMRGARKKRKKQSCTGEIYYLIGLCLPGRQDADCLPLCVHCVMGAMASARAPESWLQPHPELLSTITVNSVWETHRRPEMDSCPCNCILFYTLSRHQAVLYHWVMLPLNSTLSDFISITFLCPILRNSGVQE